MRYLFLALCLIATSLSAGSSWFFIKAGITTTVLDTFVGVDHTALESHTPDTNTFGGGWQKVGSTAEILSNLLVGIAGQTDPLYVVNAGITEGTVTMNITLDVSDSQVDIYAAASSIAAGGRLILICYPSLNQVQFYQGGVLSPPGTISNTFVAGPQVWKLVIAGSTATFYIDGAIIGSPVTITPSADTYYGFELYHPGGGGPPLTTVSRFKVTSP